MAIKKMAAVAVKVVVGGVVFVQRTEDGKKWFIGDGTDFSFEKTTI